MEEETNMVQGNRLAQFGLALLVASIAAPIGDGAHAQNLTKLSIVVFSPPSLGAFMPPVIKAKKLDEANGLDISFQGSARRMPIPRSSIPVSSRSAAAPR